MTRAVSDFDLERLLAGDVSDAERAELMARVDADERLRLLLADRRREDEAYRAGHPRFGRPESPGWRWRGWSPRLVAPVALAAAAVLVFLVVPPVSDPPGTTVAYRSGGVPARVLVKRDETFFVYRGQPLRAGDALRIEVSLAAAATCSVSDRSGKANVPPQLVYPPEKFLPGTHTFPDSLVLDGESGTEILELHCVDERGNVAKSELVLEKEPALAQP